MYGFGLGLGLFAIGKAVEAVFNAQERHEAKTEAWREDQRSRGLSGGLAEPRLVRTNPSFEGDLQFAAFGGVCLLVMGAGVLWMLLK